MQCGKHTSNKNKNNNHSPHALPPPPHQATTSSSSITKYYKATRDTTNLTRRYSLHEARYNISILPTIMSRCRLFFRLLHSSAAIDRRHTYIQKHRTTTITGRTNNRKTLGGSNKGSTCILLSPSPPFFPHSPPPFFLLFIFQQIFGLANARQGAMSLLRQETQDHRHESFTITITWHASHYIVVTRSFTRFVSPCVP